MSGPRTIEIRITCVATGEAFRYTEQIDDDEGLNWQWSDGNYGCDCNRRLFFHRAKGIDEPAEHRCGEGAFYVQITEAGNVIFDDGPEAP